MGYLWTIDKSKWIGHMSDIKIEQKSSALLGGCSFQIKAVVLMVEDSVGYNMVNPIPMYSFGRWTGNMMNTIWIDDNRFRFDPVGLLQCLEWTNRFKGGKNKWI